MDSVRIVSEAIESSDLIRAVSQVRQDRGSALALGGEATVPLSEDQIRQLEAAGNAAENWADVRVAKGFGPSRVRGCSFFGKVVLGRFEDTVEIGGGFAVPSGIYHSTLHDCVIGHNALVRDVRLLSRYVIAPKAVICDVGALSAEGETSFGTGLELPLAIESGGREVRVFPEITVDLAASIARSRGDKPLLTAYDEAVGRYAKAATSSMAIVEAGAVIRHTGRIVDSYVGPAARIINATAVLSSAILSSREEPVHVGDGAYVERSILQWGSEVTTGAIVQRSVLTEHSHAERHGKVTDSILGPNTGVAEGEVTASLLGPFVGFHHQALLIAALWPEGKGNVGYGANVGSNHTSKAPDQELWAGEGTFFGLGVNIKFPSDFTRAPYSIFATGVNALPQKICFPLSLINSPSASYPGISPAYNEIVPAWLLTDNMYTLKRNEGKYKARNKARRTHFEFDVFRPDIVDLMLDARARLSAPDQAPGDAEGAATRVKDIYTDRDIPGLGKNYLLEADRKRAIEAYSFYIGYYGLQELKRWLEGVRGRGSGIGLEQFLATKGDDAGWEHARQVLQRERASGNPYLSECTDLRAMLRCLVDMQRKVAQAVEDSKRKDDERGRRIIDDYADAHTPAERDKFVRQTWQETEAFQQEVESLIEQLRSS